MEKTNRFVATLLASVLAAFAAGGGENRPLSPKGRFNAPRSRSARVIKMRMAPFSCVPNDIFDTISIK